MQQQRTNPKASINTRTRNSNQTISNWTLTLIITRALIIMLIPMKRHLGVQWWSLTLWWVNKIIQSNNVIRCVQNAVDTIQKELSHEHVHTRARTRRHTHAREHTRTPQSCVNVGISSTKSGLGVEQFSYRDCKLTPHIASQSRMAQSMYTSQYLSRDSGEIYADRITYRTFSQGSNSSQIFMKFSTIMIKCQVV
jgi:hypothetical protein